jgi:2-oxoglutarate ferredoxin oxidoreductase subunit alpha
VRQTSSTHGSDGYITTDPKVIQQTQIRLQAKIEATIDHYTYYEEQPVAGAETLIITYGVTARAAKAAVQELAAVGQPVSLLILKTLWPVPADVITRTAAGAKRIVVLEMNLGQYVHVIERFLPGRTIEFLGQMDGNLITPAQIREVLTNG